MLRRGVLALLKAPRRVLCVAFVLSLAAWSVLIDWESGHSALNVDPSVRALLPRDGEAVARFETIRDRFSSDDLLLIAMVADDLYTPKNLAALKRLTKRIERTPGVEHVESLATAVYTQVYEDYTEVGAYLADLPTTEEEALAVRDAVLRNPLYAGYLASPDGRGATIAVRFDRDLSSRRMIQLVSAIRRATAEEGVGVESFLSGPLFVRLEISRLLLRDLFHVMPIAIFATLVVAALGFRHVRGVLLPIAANIVALLVTLALFVATGHTLNYITVILPPTVYVVGFAYSIHVVTDFDWHLARGLERTAAAAAALRDVFTPVSLTALTTAAGFASLTISDIAAIHTFGLFASIGTVMAWLCAITIVPTGLCCLRASPRPGSARRTTTIGQSLARAARKYRWWYLASGVALVLVSIAGVQRIEVSTDYLANFPKVGTVRSDFERVNQDFAGAVPLQIVIETNEIDAVKTPAVLRYVHDLKHWLLAQPEIGGVYTLLDYIGELENALAPDLVDDDPVPESRGLASHLILLGGSEDVRRFADPEFMSTMVQVRAKVVASGKLNELTRRIEDYLVSAPPGITATVTGSSYLIARTLDDVTRGQVLSLTAALVPIGAVMLWLFRSGLIAVLALLPNVMPILAFFGILGWSGVTLNLTTSLVASVVLGIAVDDSLHFFARFKQAAKDASASADQLATALAAVARPVTFTTASLAIGFSTLVEGELRAQVEFGLLAAITLVIAWILDLTFTPALAQGFRRFAPDPD